MLKCSTGYTNWHTKKKGQTVVWTFNKLTQLEVFPVLKLSRILFNVRKYPIFSDYLLVNSLISYKLLRRSKDFYVNVK